MKREIISILILFTVFSNLLFAQSNDPDAMIANRLRTSIAELENSLEADCDPYGFAVSIKAAVRKDGQISMYNMDKDVLLAEINPFMARQKFNRFDFEMQPKIFLGEGKFLFSCGLVSRGNAEDIRDIELYAERYTYQIVKNGERFDLIVHTDISIVMTKPNDGSILGDVYYHTKDGGKILWDKQTWLNKLPQVAYIRVGPGDDNANSRKGYDRYETLGAVSNPYEITISNYFTPGHYLPVIKFRKCVQDYTEYNNFKHLEAIVKITNLVNWSDFKEHSTGKVIPKTTMKAERAKAPNFHSYFSTGNIVEGNILDSKGNPIEETVTVILEPDFEPAPGILTVESMPGGKYEFEDVESGVYKLYLATSKDNYVTVEVCNCPQEGEGPNHRYVQDLKAIPAYDIFVSFKSPSNIMGSMEVVWRNVEIAFMEDDSITVYNAYDMMLVRSISPPFKINEPPTGIDTYYSSIVETAPEVISWGISDCKINKRGDHINSFSILKTKRHNKIHMELCIDLTCYDNDGNPFQVTVDNTPDGTFFKWDVLNTATIEKLKSGSPAEIVFPTHKVYDMTVRFVPVE